MSPGGCVFPPASSCGHTHPSPDAYGYQDSPLYTTFPARSDKHAHSVVPRRLRSPRPAWPAGQETMGSSAVRPTSGPARWRTADAGGISSGGSVGGTLWIPTGIVGSPGSLGGGSLGYAPRPLAALSRIGR